MLRKILEKISRGKRIKRTIHVRGIKVPIYVSPDSQLKYLKPWGAWDRDLVKLVEDYVEPGADVWDIGANVGVFTFAAAAASQTGKIIAFEPDIFLVETMQATINLNDFEHVTVLPVALSDKDGFAEFHIAQRGRASNSLKVAGGRSQMGGVRKIYTVPTFCGNTIGNHLLSAPKLIKIDVEGAELLVLQGITDILRKYKPVIYIELGEETREKARTFLHEAGYVLNDGDCSQSGLGNFLFTPVANTTGILSQ